jgi:hypothetical protein
MSNGIGRITVWKVKTTTGVLEGFELGFGLEDDPLPIGADSARLAGVLAVPASK